MQRTLFQPASTLTKNKTGGNAYRLDNKTSLATYATTGILENTYRSDAKENLETVLSLCNTLDSKYIAQVACYAHTYGYMRDMPVLLVAYLSTRPDKEYFYAAFQEVITNVGMIRKFVQIIRSGKLGRRSLGSAPKKAINAFLNSHTADRLFWQATGTQPSIGDVIKLTHPSPDSREKDRLYQYFIGKTLSEEDLRESCSKVQAFEDFKLSRTDEVPDVPYNRLTSLNLSKEQWTEVFKKMTWNQLRKQLNTAERKGILTPQTLAYFNEVLRDSARIQGSKVLPFSIFSTIEGLSPTLPSMLKDAMIHALEVSLENAPTFGNKKVVILVDVSGSMRMYHASQKTQSRAYVTKGESGIRCIEVAGVFAAALYKANPKNCTILPFDTQVRDSAFDATQPLINIVNKLASYGGGATDISCGIEFLNNVNYETDLVIIISDNESWRGTYLHNRTSTMQAWNNYSRKYPNSKLVLWDIIPSVDSQVKDQSNILNVAGFSDIVFEVIKMFSESTSPQHWADLISQMKL